MNFGGRVIELDAAGTVTRISRPGELLLADVGLSLRPGDRPALADLTRVCDRMAALTLRVDRRRHLRAGAAALPDAPGSGRYGARAGVDVLGRDWAPVL